MPSTNGHARRLAIPYARVSTEEQARSGYSLAQQFEACRAWCAREGFEILEEVADPGQSGASLERPGMDHVRDLVAKHGRGDEVELVVLAQDRDRFSREPAYTYLLRREFEEHGTVLRALNDRGDDSPEGELTDGILDQLAKYERAKIAERSRRGKMRKAREGKVIAGRMSRYDGAARYGYRFNEARDALMVDEEKMSVVRRIFRMVGVEGAPIYAVKRALDAEGVPTATGKGKWAPSMIRDIIMGDLYVPHPYQEVASVVSPEVAAKLDSEESYGLWEWGVTRHTRTRVSELTSEGDRVYRTRSKVTLKPEGDRVYVPVPSSGVPREWISAAREAIKDNRRASNAGRRFWELSGGILRCAECGWTMYAHTASPVAGVYRNFYYVCKAKYKKGPEFCIAARTRKAAELEGRVWAEVRAYLEEPERLRSDLDRAVALERDAGKGDPARETKVWAEKLAEVDAKRARFQHAYAEGVVGLEDLRERLMELEEEQATAERELATLRDRATRVRDLERDRDAVLEGLLGDASEALDCMKPEQRHRFYKMLRLKVHLAADDSLEITGVFPEPIKSGPVLCTTDVSR